MSAVVNARDALLQAASTRLETIALPSNWTVPNAQVLGLGALALLNAVSATTQVTGLGALATQNSVNLATQVTGTLATGNISGLGALALLDSVNLATQTTGTINANTQVTNLGTLAFANSLAANQIGAGTLAAGVIYAGAIATSQLTAGSATDARGSIELLGFSTVAKISRTGSTTLPALFISDTAGTTTGAFYCSSNVSAATPPGERFSATFTCGSTTTLLMESTNSGYSAAKAINTSSGKKVWLAAGGYAVYSDTGEGKHYAKDGLGPFTGFHDGLLPKTVAYEIGDIMVDAAVVHKQDVNNTLTEVELSSAPNQKTAIGVISAARDIDEFIALPYETRCAYADTHDVVDINGVGEGQINVCGEGDDIQAGDLIVTSSIPGKGMRQADDLVRSHTVAKARESVTFSSPSEVKMIACTYLCG